MKIKFLSLVLISLFLVQTASAAIVINIYIDESGDALFLGQADEQALSLPQGVSLEEGEISGITSDITSKNGEVWSVNYSLTGSDLTLILPKGAKILDLSGGEIFLSDDRFSIFAQDSVQIEYRIEQQASGSALSLALFIILIIIVMSALAFVIFSRYKKSRNKTKLKSLPSRKIESRQDKLDIIKQVLSDREKLILDKLKETGKVKSSHLRKLCGIPKASFSRHIQELEKKGLIKRSGEGKNKFIELIK